MTTGELPFDKLATKVFAEPAFKFESVDARLKNGVVLTVAPFNVQETAQLESFGVTPNEVVVPDAAAIFSDAPDGVLELTEQEGSTVTGQVQAVVS